jgi:Amt family ammonium transporter
MKLWAFLLFAVVMTGFIYPVQGFWKWGGGFLDALGFLDFAGSGVVHMTGAAAALAGVILLGARKGKYGPKGEVHAIPGANMPLATLGTFILWLGWFGFNGGSELMVSNVDEANAVSLVFVNTNAAAAAGLVAALLTARIRFGKSDLTMAPSWWCSRSRPSTSSRSTTRSAPSRCTAWSASGACWRSR